MPAPMDQTKVLEALRQLGINPQEIQALRFAPYPRAQDMLAALKDRARKAYKRLALELHPDRTGNDPVKTDRFKLVGQVIADLDKLQIQPPPPPPPPVVHVQYTVPITWVQVSQVSTSSTAGTATQMNPNYVVFMRPR